jgi:hypothetical protein
MAVPRRRALLLATLAAAACLLAAAAPATAQTAAPAPRRGLLQQRPHGGRALRQAQPVSFNIYGPSPLPNASAITTCVSRGNTGRDTQQIGGGWQGRLPEGRMGLDRITYPTPEPRRAKQAQEELPCYGTSSRFARDGPKRAARRPPLGCARAACISPPPTSSRAPRGRPGPRPSPKQTRAPARPTPRRRHPLPLVQPGPMDGRLPHPD